MASNAEKASIWWRHQANILYGCFTVSGMTSPLDSEVTLKGVGQTDRNHSTNKTRHLLSLGSVNKRRRYNVTSSLIGWAHTQNDPYTCACSSGYTVSEVSITRQWTWTHLISNISIGILIGWKFKIIWHSWALQNYPRCMIREHINLKQYQLILSSQCEFNPHANG